MGTGAGRVPSVSCCAPGGSGGVGVGGPAPRSEPGPHRPAQCGAPESLGDAWGPRGLARASGAIPTSPAGSQVHAAHVGRLCDLTGEEDMSAIGLLLWRRGDGQSPVPELGALASP